MSVWIIVKEDGTPGAATNDPEKATLWKTNGYAVKEMVEKSSDFGWVTKSCVQRLRQGCTTGGYAYVLRVWRGDKPRKARGSKVEYVQLMAVVG